MAILKYVNEAGEEDLVHVGPDRPRVLIGRSKECDLKTKNNTVSRQHAVVCWQDGRYVLQDLGSANGTFYRRQRVTEVILEDGESLFCGTFQIEFHLDERDRAPVVRASARPAPAGRAVPRDEEPPVPPPLPSQPVRPTTEPKAVSPPASAAAPEVLGRTLGYDTAGFAEVQASRGPRPTVEPDARGREAPQEDMEDVTFALEEEVPPPPPVEAPRRGTPPLDTRAEATGVVDFRAEAPREDLDRILKADREREAREEALKAENERLRAEVRERDEAIRLLKVQVEELGKVVARYEAMETERDTELRVADLERVLQATEAERARLEEDLESQRALLEEERARAREASEQATALAAEVEAVRAERDGLVAQVEALETQVAEANRRVEDLSREVAEARRTAEQEAASRREIAETAARVSALERDIEGARAREKEAAQALKRLETEKAALEEELQRWEALKRQFEEERSEARVEIEGLRRQVAELTARLADASTAAERAVALDEQLRVVMQELSEVKTANRSYLKKISRLLEEVEQAKAGAGASGEIAALKAENQRLEEEVSKLRRDLAEARKQVERLNERVTAAPPPPPGGGQVADLGLVRAVVERVNDLVSEGRTSLDVVTGLVSELAERVAGLPEVADLVEQIRAAADELAKAMKDMKGEAVQARNLLRGGGR